MLYKGRAPKQYSIEEQTALLKLFETHTTKDLAAKYGVSTSTITKRIAKARDDLDKAGVPYVRSLYK